ncbi:putative C-type lectin domain family 20 member A [Astyanax mexicanus]|uniref:Putative C-type lectin domain family 20 member A n=1 Tax=Astyanax mexicanus TaxID=7994 RepID=A0A8T2LIC9_ASTMX|nr:putative C-type lectin domain family 20 member A [Astyanax mexicanus]
MSLQIFTLSCTERKKNVLNQLKIRFLFISRNVTIRKSICEHLSCPVRALLDIIKMSWKEAQQFCRLHYDDLSTVSNIEENDILMHTKPFFCSFYYNFNFCNVGNRWIGLYTDKETEHSVWKWSWEEEQATFTLWAKKEPYYSGPDNCAYQDSRAGDWYSVSCSLNLTFFCMNDAKSVQSSNQSKGRLF